MEKEIIITPETIEHKTEPVISINKSGICFNKSAEKLLALKEGDYFSLVYKNKKLYYKQETNKGFKLVRRVKNKGSYAKLGYYTIKIHNFFEEYNIPIGRYEIGIMKDGLRELIYIKNQSK